MFDSLVIHPITKALLLQCNLFATHKTLQQPTTDPRREEEERFRRESATQEMFPGLLVWGGHFLKFALYALYATESTVLIATYGEHVSLIPGLSENLAGSVATVGARLRLTPYFLLGNLLVCIGGAVRAACYRQLGRRFTFRLALRADHALETGGPYAVVRHPSYGGALAFVVGTYMCVRDRASLLAALGVWDTPWGTALRFGGVVLAVLASFAFVDRARVEDEALKHKFGRQWEIWARRTPYKLIPFIF